MLNKFKITLLAKSKPKKKTSKAFERMTDSQKTQKIFPKTKNNKKKIQQFFFDSRSIKKKN